MPICNLQLKQHKRQPSVSGGKYPQTSHHDILLLHLPPNLNTPSCSPTLHFTISAMESHIIEPTTLRLSSSFSIAPTTCSIKVPTDFTYKTNPPFLYIKASKRNSGTNGIQKEAKELSRILRTDLAVKGIERKTNSKKHNNLCPKPVLEALDQAIRDKKWESALKIFGLLRKQRWYEPRCQTYTKILVMLGKCRQAEQASLLFEVMLSDGLKPTLDVYTALVSAYGQSGLIDKAISTLDDMKSVTDCRPDVYTYSILINCCTKLHRFDLIKEILAEMSYLDVECSTVTYNTVIDGYGKAKMFELMENSLNDMIESESCTPDVFTMNSFLGAYGNNDQIEKMEKWYDEFQLMGIKPDIKTFNILLRSYGKSGLYEKMSSVLEFMTKRYFSPTIVTFNIIIEVFGKAGNVEKMYEFYQNMKHQGMKPNSITYCSLVNAYCKAGCIDKVNSILRQVANSNVVLDTPFFNCAMNAYSRLGDIDSMGALLLSMKEQDCKPDNITFATMIQAYNAQGMSEAALDLEEKMIAMRSNAEMKFISY